MEEMIYYSCVIKKQAHNRAANSVLRGSISFFLFLHVFIYLNFYYVVGVFVRFFGTYG